MIIYFIGLNELIVPKEEIKSYVFNQFKWFNITLLASMLFAIPITALTLLLSFFIADMSFFTERFNEIIEKYEL